ncbi:MAG: HipA domain-containing protein [Pelovirga sp.]
MKTNRQQLLQLLADRVMTSRELVRELGISQPTLSRLINTMQNEIVVMGKGRATCYGLPNKPGQEFNRLPVYSIDAKGDVHPYGQLTPLQGGQYWWQSIACSGEISHQLPWQIQDLLINGYCARTFALRYGDYLKLSPRVTDWTEEDMLIATSRCGEDRPGNLILGEESLARYFELVRNPPELIEPGSQTHEYPQLALKTLARETTPLQLSGEQPKFSVCLNERGAPCWMLVKFSPAADSKEARRYADLLVCEHLALEAIRLAGLNAARSRLVISGNQTFLCIKRFDRRGLFGRLPAISLRALHTRIQEPCDDWVSAATRLQKQGIIPLSEAGKLHWLALFSDMIGNANQHFGNISFLPHGKDNFLLAPAYGMRPTIYEPLAGEIPARLFTPPSLRKEAEAQLVNARQAALLFWKSAAIDERISEGFRQVCFENCELLQLQERGAKNSQPGQDFFINKD